MIIFRTTSGIRNTHSFFNLRKYAIVFILIILCSSVANSQNQASKIGILKGIISDSVSKQPIDYASVRLLSQKDSSNIAEIYSDEKGFFILEQIPAGKYFVKISFFGYLPKIIQDVSFSAEAPGRDLGLIRLHQERATKLDEVSVTAKQELFVNALDKKIYNVGEDLSVKGGTVSDVLNNVPSIEVDQDGKISLRGDGNVTILIDGRPSTLSGGNGKSFLDALPAGSVERIEIVSNPSAKYDPDGTSGIINIVLKKNKLRGINGNVSLSAGTGNAYNGATSLSFRNAKMNMYGTYAYRYYEGDRGNNSRLNRIYPDSVFRLKQDRTGTDLMINHTARFGSDFYLKPRHTFGFTLTGNVGDRKRTGDLNNLQLDANNVELRHWKRLSQDPSTTQNVDLNLNYKWDFKEDKGVITFDASQSAGNEKSKGFYDESYISENSLPVNYPNEMQRLEGLDKNRVTTLQTDFTKLLPKNIRIESGAKAIVRRSTVFTYSESRNANTNGFEKDTLANFDYRYDEQIYSLYGSFAQKLGKFKYQGGLRLEQAMQAPNLISQQQSYRRDYFNAFPSAFMAYEITKGSDLSLGYSRRINRPTSDNLNPFTSYADPLNLRRGNPSLKPEYIHSFDLGYGFTKNKINFSATVFYRQTTDMIQRVKLFYDNGSSAASFANIDGSRTFGSELILVYKPWTWFKNVFSANGNTIRYMDNSPNYDWNNKGFMWGVKYAGTFEFWKKTASAQINARYNGPIITAQGTAQPRMSVDLSGEKTLKGGKWSVGFRLTDLFNTQEFVLEVDQPGIYQYSRFKQNTRRFYINVSYKFGKYDVSKKSKVSQDGGGGDF